MSRKSAFLLILSALLVAGLASAAEPACPNCPPDESTGDVFDPNSCIGPTISSQMAARLFCQGASRVDLARFTYAVRARVCNKYTGCDGWRALDPHRYVGSYISGSYELASYLTEGTLALNTVTNGVRVNFVSSGFHTPNDRLNTYSSYPLPDNQSTSDPIGAQYVLQSGTTNSPYIYFSSLSDTDRMIASTVGARIQFTDHCARFVAKTTSSPGPDASWIEYELGGLAKYRPGMAFRRYYKKPRR